MPGNQGPSPTYLPTRHSAVHRRVGGFITELRPPTKRRVTPDGRRPTAGSVRVKTERRVPKVNKDHTQLTRRTAERRVSKVKLPEHFHLDSPAPAPPQGHTPAAGPGRPARPLGDHEVSPPRNPRVRPPEVPPSTAPACGCVTADGGSYSTPEKIWLVDG